MNSAPSRNCWRRAESSMPRQQIQVITTIQTTPMSVTPNVGRAVVAEQLEGVEARDLRQVRHHDHVGDDDRPAAHPARARAHRLGHPREGGAAVRVGAVHVVVGRAMQSIGRNATIMIAGAWKPTTRGDEAQRRRQAVAGRGRRDADHHVREERDRAGLELRVLRRPRPDRRLSMRSPRRALLHLRGYGRAILCGRRFHMQLSIAAQAVSIPVHGRGRAGLQGCASGGRRHPAVDPR